MLEMFVFVILFQVAETINRSARQSHSTHTPPRLSSCEDRQYDPGAYRKSLPAE